MKNSDVGKALGIGIVKANKSKIEVKKRDSKKFFADTEASKMFTHPGMGAGKMFK